MVDNSLGCGWNGGDRWSSLSAGLADVRQSDCSLLLGDQIVSWRSGAKLFREMWPLIQTHIPEGEVRDEFVRDLLDFFMDCDMDGTDLRRLHPEIDKALDELDVGSG
ncbi:MAG TPA: hypothetical protein VML55_25485 [Planctomycetaceae bacterium]|nr:hypothetical protein [Planctomycetaceae bacterium]